MLTYTSAYACKQVHTRVQSHAYASSCHKVTKKHLIIHIEAIQDPVRSFQFSSKTINNFLLSLLVPKIKETINSKYQRIFFVQNTQSALLAAAVNYQMLCTKE